MEKKVKVGTMVVHLINDSNRREFIKSAHKGRERLFEAIERGEKKLFMIL
ncbi:hypothetical protein J2S74_004140 [Evansella vedderi]|uniref:Uncharacterized protein n=1 Tax=Evansella vedderi TaxID=38282 RepID=A0ABU0A1Y7_9BACI|nr:hypothetical protein [Evansella vedderi]MDQ0256718.1 hypothetical protein [Evansella vedderi]